MVPFIAGVAILIAAERPSIGGRSLRLLDWSLIACLLAVAVQLIPLPATIRASLSPEAFSVDRALRLDAPPAVPPPQALSLDVESTAWAFALGVGYIGLFWCARAIFARGGVRSLTRGVTWLGLALTVVVAAQRATSPKLLYWYFRPLSVGASPYGPFVSRNGLASWLAMTLPLVVGYAMARHETRPHAGSSIAARAEALDSTQLWLAASACLMLAGLLGSTSRAGIFGGFVGLLAFIGLSRMRVTRKAGVASMLAAVGVMIAAASLYANMGALAMRLRDTTEQGEWGRAAIWRDTWRMARDFWLTGVGAGAYQHGMLVYQEGSRLFFFNHAHDEYLQLFAEGGLLVVVPAAIAVLAAATLAVRRLRRDRTPVFWMRAGAVSGVIAVAIQSIWDTGLRTPANGALFAVMCAIALHEPRPASGEHGARERSRTRRRPEQRSDRSREPQHPSRSPAIRADRDG